MPESGTIDNHSEYEPIFYAHSIKRHENKEFHH